MSLVWVLIGALVGIVMGLTGAGGAVVSVPLFIHAIGLDVHSATTLSLLAVCAGAWFNWAFQRRSTEYRLAFGLLGFSLIGSYAFTPVKAASPDWLIRALFISVISFSGYMMMRSSSRPQAGPSGGSALADPPLRFWLKTGLSGVGLGALTTMTGLGGGVLLMPFLMGPMGLHPARALATSLFTIALVAIGSLANQYRVEAEQLARLGLAGPALMVAGILGAAALVQAVTRRLEPATVLRVRKVVFIFLIVISTIGLLLR